MAPSLNPVERALGRIFAELEAAEAQCALIGGFAVSARAEPRATRDVDVAISADADDAAEQLVFHLQSRGYVVAMLLEQEKTGRIATVRLTRESERSVYLDLLFASSGIEPEIVAAAERLAVLEDVTVRVATRAHLIAMKVLARDDRHRPQDFDDLRALLAEASDDDLESVRHALTLIEARGFNRGRDLAADLARAIEDTAR
ncbi:MAG TPA: nucleotidyl transferase AbiEii/AbiGii toxin family protein [Polyangiaceae bacterium]|nr:nucleotidyl transferase AbiEii/AbiGii toxin family protein [Polyangiaceae bacterium]